MDELLTGTPSEQAPGVGGVGDHPAPAAMRDPETGALHVAGEGPNNASGEAPVGDGFDEQAGDGLDPEAREKLNAVQEPEPYEIERPDLGCQ